MIVHIIYQSDAPFLSKRMVYPRISCSKAHWLALGDYHVPNRLQDLHHKQKEVSKTIILFHGNLLFLCDHLRVYKTRHNWFLEQNEQKKLEEKKSFWEQLYSICGRCSYSEMTESGCQKCNCILSVKPKHIGLHGSM